MGLPAQIPAPPSTVGASSSSLSTTWIEARASSIALQNADLSTLSVRVWALPPPTMKWGLAIAFTGPLMYPPLQYSVEAGAQRPPTPPRLATKP